MRLLRTIQMLLFGSLVTLGCPGCTERSSMIIPPPRVTLAEGQKLQVMQAGGAPEKAPPAKKDPAEGKPESSTKSEEKPSSTKEGAKKPEDKPGSSAKPGDKSGSDTEGTKKPDKP